MRLEQGSRVRLSVLVIREQLTTTLSPGFSPHEAHTHDAFIGWILPTLRTSEYSVLQIVGLDAAVVCRFHVG